MESFYFPLRPGPVRVFALSAQFLRRLAYAAHAFLYHLQRIGVGESNVTFNTKSRPGSQRHAFLFEQEGGEFRRISYLSAEQAFHIRHHVERAFRRVARDALDLVECRDEPV